MSTILHRWAQHAEEAADARIAEQLDAMRTALLAVAQRHDTPQGDAATLCIARAALGDDRHPVLDQTGPGQFRCMPCGAAVATADVFAHRCCRVASS